jgi:hypothetical protein
LTTVAAVKNPPADCIWVGGVLLEGLLRLAHQRTLAKLQQQQVEVILGVIVILNFCTGAK